MRARSGHRFRRLHYLLLGFHRTWTAITMNSSPPISQPFTRMRVRSLRNSRLTNLYGAEMRTAFSTCGNRFHRFETGRSIADADSADHHALLTLDRVDLITEVPYSLAHLLDLLPGRVDFIEMIIVLS